MNLKPMLRRKRKKHLSLWGWIVHSLMEQDAFISFFVIFCIKMFLHTSSISFLSHSLSIMPRFNKRSCKNPWSKPPLSSRLGFYSLRPFPRYLVYLNRTRIKNVAFSCYIYQYDIVYDCNTNLDGNALYQDDYHTS